jgi:hypothetical protein
VHLDDDLGRNDLNLFTTILADLGPLAGAPGTAFIAFGKVMVYFNALKFRARTAASAAFLRREPDEWVGFFSNLIAVGRRCIPFGLVKELSLLGLYSVDALALTAKEHALEYGVLGPLLLDERVAFGYFLIALTDRLAQIIDDEEEVFVR